MVKFRSLCNKSNFLRLPTKQSIFVKIRLDHYTILTLTVHESGVLFVCLCYRVAKSDLGSQNLWELCSRQSEDTKLLRTDILRLARTELP